jgi:hypothetical protein
VFGNGMHSINFVSRARCLARLAEPDVSECQGAVD